MKRLGMGRAGGVSLGFAAQSSSRQNRLARQATKSEDGINCFTPRVWVLLRLKTHQENNVYGIYQLFLNYFNVTISNLATTS